MGRVGLQRNYALPHLFRLHGGRLALEIHMDDIHGVGQKSEVERLLPELRKVLKLKASDGIVVWKYKHLKRTHLRHLDGVVRSMHGNGTFSFGLQNVNGLARPGRWKEVVQFEHSVL
eukprot:4210464-Amphidinium_carterae.2